MLKSEMVSYFSAEKAESVVFALLGLFSLTAGLWLVLKGHSMRGLAVPLLSIGFIQLVVGGSVYFRTDAQVASLQRQADESPAAMKSTELARMEKVMRSFVVYKVIELVVLALGLALTFFFKRNAFAYFAGVGCVLQAGLMLTADLFAEHRGAAWVSALSDR